MARVAQPENEAYWLELAQRHTLRELRREVSEVLDSTAATEEREATGLLTCTLEREDAWLLEATRALLDHSSCASPLRRRSSRGSSVLGSAP
ncbi:MAG: hypothetical protein ABI895_18345 [Deltaproteobacteria bacterium]